VKKRVVAHLIVVLTLIGNSMADEVQVSLSDKPISNWITNTFKRLEFDVLLEVAGYVSESDGETQSDIVLATAEFDFEAVVNDWMLGHVGLLWEDGSRERDHLDEAYVVLGASQSIPFYLVAGRFYQPVGDFESVFISTPLTCELAEMNQVSVMVGYKNSWIDLNVGTFRGDVKEGGGGDVVLDDFYASATFIPSALIKLGAYWFSDLMETYSYSRVGEDVADLLGYKKDGGAGAFVNFYLGSITVNAEYVSALTGYQLESGDYVPTAFHLEGSVQVNEKLVVGLKYEASNDLYATVDQQGPLRFSDKFPGQSYGVLVSYAFQKHATISAEYLHVEELDDGCSGEMATVQFSLAF